ncbi:MAG: hypothetical protein ACREIB_00615, partial [Pseudomonadota bacterium]
MPWTLPDKGEGDNDLQSILFQEDLEVLVAGIAGIDCVLSGLDVTGGADMTPAVAKGAVLSNRVMFAVAAADVTITTADATNPRIDLIVVTSAGALAVRAGTPGASPKPPARTANDVVIASVYVPANDTAIGTSQIKDRQVFPSLPICIYRTTVAETTNTTAAAIEALNKANSGVTIPSGLFLAGRILRVRLHGNMLLNSGTPTVRVAMLYGGTTMFSDISAAAANSATRRAWWIDFDVVAQANADQALGGHGQLIDPAVAPVAPTTGIGDIWGINTAAQETQTPIQGSAAVDSDAANRLLSVQITFSVS